MTSPYDPDEFDSHLIRQRCDEQRRHNNARNREQAALYQQAIAELRRRHSKEFEEIKADIYRNGVPPQAERRPYRLKRTDPS